LALKVTNYLKNATKSVAYIAADYAKEDLIPNAADFASDNKQFIVSTYAALRNPAAFMRKQVKAIQSSSVYKALDYGIRNASEDLRSGNFYNKERVNRDQSKFDGTSSFDDLSEFGIYDEDIEDILSGKSVSSDSEKVVTNGDRLVVNSIEGSTAASTSAIVKSIITTSENQIQNARINHSMVYLQNEKLLNGVHNDLSVIGSTLDTMYKITSGTLQNLDQNMSSFFTNEAKLSEERNAILKEMLQLQRNTLISASDREAATVKNAKKGNKIRWRDIQVGGVVDIDSYARAVGRNITESVKSYTDLLTMGGEGTDMLSAMLVSPLEYVIKGLVKGVIPSTIKAAVKELDESFSGIFGNVMADLANSSGNILSVKGLLSNLIGISPDANKNVNTSKYEKGAVPFDGITRRALIDVIPAYLSRIESALTGNNERIYDFEKGKWTTMSAVKQDISDIRYKNIMSGTRDIRKQMAAGINGVVGSNPDDDQAILAAFSEFWEFLYDNNGRFNPNATADKNGVSKIKYPNLYNHYNMVCTVMTASRIQQAEVGGKMTSRQLFSTQINLPKNILDAKAREDQMYRNIESGLNVMSQYYESKGISEGTAGKNKGGFGILTKDSLGNTVFDYLQNINKELIMQRKYGVTIQGGISIASDTGKGNKGGKSGKKSSKPMTDEDYKRIAGGINLTNRDLLKEQRKARKASKKEAKAYKERILKLIETGALDVSSLKDEDAAEYLYYLYGLYSNENSDEFVQELDDYNSGIIANFFSKHIRKDDIRSLDDIKNNIHSFEDLEDEDDSNTDRRKSKYLKDLFERTIGKNSEKFQNVFGTTNEEFTRILYSADKAIYDMMYKYDLKDDKGHRYEGFMDMLAGKLSDTFDETSDKFASIFKEKIEQIKESLGLSDKKETIYGQLRGDAKDLWKKFVDSNKEVWGPMGDKVLDAMGIERDEDGNFRRAGYTEAKRKEQERQYQSKARKNVTQAKIKRKQTGKASNRAKEPKPKSTANKTEEGSAAGDNSEPPESQQEAAEAAVNSAIHEQARAANDLNKKPNDNVPGKARGTTGTFSGRSALSKGETFFNKYGSGKVNKTGIYDVTTPSVILNAQDSYNLGLTSDKPDSLEECLRKEKEVARKAGYSISSNANGSVKFKDDLNEVKDKAPETAAGAILGAGAGLLGMPGGIIGGALIGAAANFIRSSDKAKKFLFGDIDEATGKRNGEGVVNRKIVNFVNDKFPDMAKYGLAGIIPGAIAGFGPVGGFAIGAGISLLKNSATINDALFGAKGAIGEKEKDILKDLKEKGKHGAIAGGLTGLAAKLIFKTSGLGILGGIVLGAGFDIMGSSGEFKNGLLGEIGPDGKRQGGVIGALADAFQPLRDASENFRDKLNETIEEGFIKPMHDFVTPFIHELPRIVTFIPRKISEFLDKTKLGKTIERKIDDWIGRPIKFITNKIFTPIVNGVLTVAKLPGRGLSAIGNRIRRGQIKRHDADYMTAQERLDFADTHDMGITGYNASYDKRLAAIGTEEGMSLDEATELRNNLYSITDTREGLKSSRKKAGKDIMKMLDNYEVDGVKLNSKTLKKVKQAIDSGRVENVEKMIREGGLRGKGAALTQDQYNNLFKSEGLGDAILKYTDLVNRENAVKNTADWDEAKKGLKDQLAAAGVDIDNARDVDRYIKNLDTEINRIRANDTSTPEEKEAAAKAKAAEQREIEVHDDVSEIRKNIEEFMKAFKMDAEGSSEYLKYAREHNQEYLWNSVDQGNEKYGEYQQKVADAFDGVSDEVINNLGTSRVNDRHADDNNAIVRTVKNAGIAVKRKVTRDYNNIDYVNKKGLTAEDLNATHGKRKESDRIAKLKRDLEGVQLYEFTDGAIELINGCSDNEFDNIHKFLTQRDVQNFCKPKYKVTKNDIKFIIGNYASHRQEFYIKCKRYYESGSTINDSEFGTFTKVYNSKSNFDQLDAIYRMYHKKYAVPENQAEEMEEATTEEEPVASNYRGTISSNGLGSIIGGLLSPYTFGISGLIGSGIDTAASLAVKGAKAAVSGAGKLIGGAARLAGKAINGVKGAFSSDGSSSSVNNTILGNGLLGESAAGNTGSGGGGGGDFDETDKPGDGRDLVHVGDGQMIYVKRDSSGNVEPDTTDSRTKDIMNKIDLKAKAANAAQKAQEKLSDMFKDTFSSEGLEKGKKGMSIFKWLLLGGVALKSGILQNLFNNIIKPLWSNWLYPYIVQPMWEGIKSFATGIWTDTVYPWLTDTVWPWLKDTAIPWVINTAVPAIVDAVMNVNDSSEHEEADAEATENTSSYYEEHADEKSGYYDSKGNELTYSQVAEAQENGTTIYTSDNKEIAATSTDINIKNTEKANTSWKDKAAAGFFKYTPFGLISTGYYTASGNKIRDVDIESYRQSHATFYDKDGNPYHYNDNYHLTSGEYTGVSAYKNLSGYYDKSGTELTYSQIAKQVADGNTTIYDSNGAAYVVKSYNASKRELKVEANDSSTSSISSYVNNVLSNWYAEDPDFVTGDNGIYNYLAYSVSGAGGKLLSKIGFTDAFTPENAYNTISSMGSDAYDAISSVGNGIYNFFSGGSGSGNKNKPLAMYGRAKEALNTSDTTVSAYIPLSTQTTLTEDSSDNVQEQTVLPYTYWSDLQATNLTTFSDKLTNTINTPLQIVENVVNAAADSMDDVQSWIVNRLSAVSEFITDPTGKIIEWITTDTSTTNNNPGTTKTTTNTSKTSSATKVKTSTTSTSSSSKKSSSSSSSSTGLISKVKSFFSNLFGTGAQYGMGYSKQIDPSISSIRFNAGGDSEYQTIGDSGCGPAAAVNALEAMYGRGSNVVSAAQYAISRGYKERNGGTMPGFFGDYFSRNGYASQTTSNKSTLATNIRAGLPTVLMGTDSNGVSSRTPYGTSPHYVTATGVDSNGHVIIQDPESKYDNQLYSINDVLSKTSFGVSAMGKYGRGRRTSRTVFGRGRDVLNQDLCTWADVTADELNSWMASYRRTNSPFLGNGALFIEIANSTGMDPVYIIAHAANESGWGNSNYAVNRGNYFGIGAFDSNPDAAYTFTTSSTNSNFHPEGLLQGVQWIKKNYYDYGQTTLYLYNNPPDGWHNYSTGNWDTVISIMNSCYNSISGYDTRKKYKHTGDGSTSVSSSSSTSTNYSSTGTTSSTSSSGSTGLIGTLSNLLANSRIGQAFYKLIGVSDSTSNNTSSNTSSSSSTTSTTSSTNLTNTGNASFPKYNLTDDQINGIANIVGHEQGTEAGWLAEASLMANRTDIKGDQYATPENLVKQVTGGWFAYGSSRYKTRERTNSGTVNAVKTAIVEGKRTVPRYINEHDYIGDLTSVTTNGKSISASNRSGYVQHQTKIKNKYGSTYTFYSFPSPTSDPFGYTDDSYRTKWGDSHYGTGKFGRGKEENASKVWWYLKKNGMSDNGAAGILGNLEAESGISPTNLQNSYETILGYTDDSYTQAVDDGTYTNFADDSAGYGIAQFTYNAYKKALLARAKNRNKSIGSLTNQTEYLTEYVKGSMSSLWNSLLNASDPSAAATLFLTQYEKPTDQSTSVKNYRGKLAKAWYTKLTGTEGTELDDADTTSSSDSSTASDSTTTTTTNAVSSSTGLIGTLSDLLTNSRVGQAFYKLIGVTNSNNTTTSSTSSTSYSGTTSSSVDASGDAAALVKVAENEIGYTEKASNANLDDATANAGSNDYTKYGEYTGANGAPWCASFISWCANQAGISTDVIPKTAAAATLRNASSTHPTPQNATAGDFITYDYSNDGTVDHVSLVESRNDTGLTAIDGNWNNRVERVTHKFSDGTSTWTITRPNYANTIRDTSTTEEADTISNVVDKSNTTSSSILDKALSVVGTTGTKSTSTTSTSTTKSTGTNLRDSSNSNSTLGSNTIGSSLINKASVLGTGGNNNKPLARFGRFKNATNGRGSIYSVKYNTIRDAFGNIIGTTETSIEDQEIAAQHRGNSGYGRGTVQYGMATTRDYSNLIDSIITVLYTIADNTDKLNVIVTILNNKLGTNITSSDVAEATNSNSSLLKEKLQSTLTGNAVSQASKLNSIADELGDSSITSIISAMNAIASE
jgi:beta-N-acetylglucosaminidase